MKREWIFAGTGALIGGLLSGGVAFYFMRKQNKKQAMEFNDFVAEAFSKLNEDGRKTLKEVMHVKSPSAEIFNFYQTSMDGLDREAERDAAVNVTNVNVMKKEFTPSKAMEEMTERLSMGAKKVQTDDNLVEIITENDFGESFIGEDGEWHDYPLVEYRFYADGVLCNENDEVVNARELLGDPVWAEYHDKYFKSRDLPDTMYVRLHKLELDVEIVGDPQSFKDDVLPTLPHVGLEVGVTDPDDDPFKRTYDSD